VFGLFKGKASSWVGVDIGSSSVKLVVLSRHGSQIGLDAYAVVALPHSAVVDNHIQEIGLVAESIERGVKICGGKIGSAVTAVPSSAVIIKHMEMSNAFTEAELEDQIKVEADQFIPYSLDEVAIDFELRGPCSHNPNLNEILLVACRNQDVEQREAAINSAGLKCEVVDVDNYAVERLLPKISNSDDQNGLVAIVDIGSSTLTLNVFRGDKIIYNREQAFGGSELTNSISQHYGMPQEEVEQALRLGEISDEVREMLVEPFKFTVSQQVSRAMQFFYSSGIQDPLSKLFLAGGTTSIAGLTDQLEEDLGLAVEMANPFMAMDIGAKVNRDRLLKDAPTLAKACGLALRSFDL